jgi:hypothetical protein
MFYQVAVIGTGAEPDDPGRGGYTMAETGALIPEPTADAAGDE